jgi:hypothetical protein
MKYLDRATGVCCGKIVKLPRKYYDDYQEVAGQCPSCGVTWELERVCIECGMELPEGYPCECTECDCDEIIGVHSYYKCE